jgi:hypothetical protein
VVELHAGPSRRPTAVYRQDPGGGGLPDGRFDAILCVRGGLAMIQGTPGFKDANASTSMVNRSPSVARAQLNLAATWWSL